ncbi:hypothetical protein Hanom_Chr16g01516071 [Helianthus anomalus]
MTVRSPLVAQPCNHHYIQVKSHAECTCITNQTFSEQVVNRSAGSSFVFVRLLNKQEQLIMYV